MFNKKSILSTLGFQLVWWGLLGLAAKGRSVEACLLGAAYVAFHVLYTAKERTLNEFKFILLFGFLGWFLDSLFIYLRILDFHGTAWAPLWVLFMWFNYMTSMHYSMVYIFRSLPLTLFIGFIFGPWTYLACYGLKLVSFPFSLVLSLVVLGFVWMIWIYIYRIIVLRSNVDGVANLRANVNP